MRRHEGFSLIEIAVVLVILTILTAIVAVPIATQVEQRRTEETQKLLDGAMDALYGFAAAKGRLPCPAPIGSASGRESFCTTSTGGCTATTIEQAHGRCQVNAGLLPAVTLGLSPVDASGFMLDAWADGTDARRVRYAVSDYQNPANTFVMTATDGIRNAMSATGGADHLFICATGLAAAPPTANCGAMTLLSSQAPAIVFSLGKESAANSFDETNNQNGDKVFSSGIPNATFDDIMRWMSVNTLFDRMVRAGKLP